MSLLRDLNYKQTHQMMSIWNGFHMIVFIMNGLPTHPDIYVKLIPLEVTASTHDLYYAKVNYLLIRHVY